MSLSIVGFLASNTALMIGRLLLTFVFWSDAILQAMRFRAVSSALQDRFELRPGWAFNAATMILKLLASLMIVLDHGASVAAGGLAVFTLATIPIAHPFWARQGEQAFNARNFAMEHLSLIGGLMLAAILSGARC